MSTKIKEILEEITDIYQEEDEEEALNSFGCPLWLEKDLMNIISYMTQYKKVINEEGCEVPVSRFGIYSLLLQKTPVFIYNNKVIELFFGKTAFTDGVNIFIDMDFYLELIKEEQEYQEYYRNNYYKPGFDRMVKEKHGVIPLILHELSHIIEDDVYRLREYDSALANIAQDLLHNTNLQLQFPELKWVHYLTSMGYGFKNEEKKYATMSEEEIAEELYKYQKEKEEEKEEEKNEKNIPLLKINHPNNEESDDDETENNDSSDSKVDSNDALEEKCSEEDSEDNSEQSSSKSEKNNENDSETGEQSEGLEENSEDNSEQSSSKSEKNSKNDSETGGQSEGLEENSEDNSEQSSSKSEKNNENDSETGEQSEGLEENSEDNSEQSSSKSEKNNENDSETGEQSEGFEDSNKNNSKQSSSKPTKNNQNSSNLEEQLENFNGGEGYAKQKSSKSQTNLQQKSNSREGNNLEKDSSINNKEKFDISNENEENSDNNEIDYSENNYQSSMKTNNTVSSEEKELLEDLESKDPSKIHTRDPKEVHKIFTEAGLEKVAEKLGYPSNEDEEQDKEESYENMRKDHEILKDRTLQEAISEQDDSNSGDNYPGGPALYAARKRMKAKSKGVLKWKQVIIKEIWASGMKQRYNEDHPNDIYYVEELKELLGIPLYEGTPLSIKNDDVVLFLIDTSFSMSMDKSILQNVVNECVSFKRASSYSESAREVVIMSADTSLKGDPIIINDDNVEEILKNGFELNGYGGTDFLICIKQAIESKEMKDKKIKSIVYFTDLGDIPPLKAELGLEEDVSFTYIATGDYRGLINLFRKTVEDYASVIPLVEGEEVDLSLRKRK